MLCLWDVLCIALRSCSSRQYQRSNWSLRISRSGQVEMFKYSQNNEDIIKSNEHFEERLATCYVCIAVYLFCPSTHSSWKTSMLKVYHQPRIHPALSYQANPYATENRNQIYLRMDDALRLRRSAFWALASLTRLARIAAYSFYTLLEVRNAC